MVREKIRRMDGSYMFISDHFCILMSEHPSEIYDVSILTRCGLYRFSKVATTRVFAIRQKLVHVSCPVNRSLCNFGADGLRHVLTLKPYSLRQQFWWADGPFGPSQSLLAHEWSTSMGRDDLD